MLLGLLSRRQILSNTSLVRHGMDIKARIRGMESMKELLKYVSSCILVIDSPDMFLRRHPDKFNQEG